eukprot:366223-Chlamydomonas_euryale.AAC.20
MRFGPQPQALGHSISAARSFNFSNLAAQRHVFISSRLASSTAALLRGRDQSGQENMGLCNLHKIISRGGRRREWLGNHHGLSNCLTRLGMSMEMTSSICLIIADVTFGNWLRSNAERISRNRCGSGKSPTGRWCSR